MKSLKFSKVNIVYAEDNPVYQVYAYRDNSPKGQKDIVACFGLNFWERLMVLITGKIWINITTLDGNIRPMRMTVLKKNVLTTRKERRDKEKIQRKIRKKISIPPPGENGLKAVK